jgi:hypothetical protein
MILGDYLVLNQSGTTGSGAPATLAPNITSATVVVDYGQWANASAYGFEGVITLPTADAEYAHLKVIHIIATFPDGSESDVCPIIPAEEFGATTVAYKGEIKFLQNGLPHNVTLNFWCVNEDGVRTPTPYSVVAAIQAAVVTAVSGREVPNSLEVDTATRLVSTTIGGTPTLGNSQYPQTVAYWLSEDNGSNYIWIGYQVVPAAGTEIRFARVKPVTNETWKIAMAVGPIGGDPSVRIPAASLPVEAAISPGFTVGALAVPAASTLATLDVPAGTVPGNWPYNKTTVDGVNYWSVPSISVDATNAEADPNVFTLALTFQDYDAAGNAIGPEHIYGTPVVAAGVINFGDLIGPYGSVADPPRTGNISKVRARVYTCNRVDQTTSAWSNPAASTFQTSLDIVVSIDGSVPPGAIPVDRLDSLGNGLYIDPSDSSLITGVGDNPGNMLTNGNFDRSIIGVSCLGWTLDAAAYPVNGGLTPPYMLRLTGLVNTYARQTRKFVVSPGQLYYAQAEWMSEVSADGTISLSIDYFDSADGYVSSDSVSVAATSITAWTRTGLACTVPSGASRAQFRINASGSTTGNFIVDNCLFRPQATTGDGTEPDGRGGVKGVAIGAPNAAGMAVAVTITAGPTTPAGIETFGWDGTVTLPTDLSVYEGCELTHQYAGSEESAAFGRLGPGETTFHNGYWPRPPANVGVTFRAYPISRDLQRGTPASVAVTVAAHAANQLNLNDVNPSTLGSGLHKTGGQVIVGTGDNPGNMLTNPSFERSVLGASSVGWTLDAAAYPVLDGITPPYALRMTGLVNTFARHTLKFTVRPGALYYAEVWWMSGGPADGTIGLSIDYFDSADVYVSSDTTTAAATNITTWTRSGLACTVPAGATKAQFRINAYGSTTGYFLVDNCLLRPQATSGAGTEPDGAGGVKLKLASTSPVTTDGSGNVILKLAQAITADEAGNLNVKLGQGVSVDGSGNLKIKNGGSVTFDGSGNVIVGAGPGLTFNAGGALVPNQGATVGVNASGQLIVPEASLGKAEFGNGFEPYAMYFGLPATGTPYNNAPTVIVNSATSPWSLWRKHAGGWRAVLDSNDIVAGNIVALASISSPAISGGSIVGSSYTAVVGNVTITIEPSNGRIRVNNTGYSWYVDITGAGVTVQDKLNSGTFTFMTGGQVGAHANGTTYALLNSDGTIFLQGSSAAVWVNGVKKVF